MNKAFRYSFYTLTLWLLLSVNTFACPENTSWAVRVYNLNEGKIATNFDVYAPTDEFSIKEVGVSCKVDGVSDLLASFEPRIESLKSLGAPKELLERNRASKEQMSRLYIKHESLSAACSFKNGVAVEAGAWFIVRKAQSNKVELTPGAFTLSYPKEDGERGQFSVKVSCFADAAKEKKRLENLLYRDDPEEETGG